MKAITKQDFLNPKSMLTPGIAGGIVMMISNTLLIQFDLPARWTALGLSALLGLVVFWAVAIPFWQRAIYYLFNVLIIFCFAVGSNRIGAATAQRNQTSPASLRYQIKGVGEMDPTLLRALADWEEARREQEPQGNDENAFLSEVIVRNLVMRAITIEVSPKATPPAGFFRDWF